MPNYGLVINGKYNPMSYEDYAKPFEDYSKAYSIMADAYDALEVQANQWEKLADSAKDQAQYNQYKNYANDLRTAAQDLADNGLSVKTRGQVSKLRQRYAKEIKPIEDAYTLREEEQKLQRQAKMQNPTIMFSRDAYDTGLGAYMAGVPEMQTYSGALLRESVQSAAKNLAREAREELIKNGKSSPWYTILGGQYYEKAIKTGLTADDVMSVMVDPNTGELNPNASPYLAKMIDTAIRQSGMRDWSNWNDLKEQAYNYAFNGAWDAIGQVEYKNLANRQWDLNHRDSGQPTMKFPAINPVNIYTTRQRSTDEKLVAEGSSMFNDKGELTNTAKAQLLGTNTWINTNTVGSPTTGATGKDIDYNPSDYFKSLYKVAKINEPDLTENDFIERIKTDHGYIKTLYEALKYNNPYAQYNANELTEYNYHLDPTEQKNYKTLISGDIYKADFDTERNVWKSTGETLKMSDLLSNDYTITDVNFGKYGTTLKVQGPDGTQEYIMPTGINPTAETRRDIRVQGAYKYAEALTSGKALKWNPDTQTYELTNTDLTEEEIAQYQAAMNQFLSEAYQYQAQIGFVNKTEPSKYTPIAY